MSLFLLFFGGDFRGKEDLIHNFTDGCVSKVQNLDFCLIGQKTKDFFFQNSTLTHIWLSVLFEKFTSQVCQPINTIFNSRPEGYKRNKRTLEWIQSIIVYYYCLLCLYSPMQQFLCYDQSLRSFITHTKKSCVSINPSSLRLSSYLLSNSDSINPFSFLRGQYTICPKTSSKWTEVPQVTLHTLIKSYIPTGQN